MEKYRVDLRVPQQERSDPYQDFNKHCNEIAQDINVFRLSQVQANVVYKALAKIIRVNVHLVENLHQQQSTSTLHYIQKAADYICRRIENHTTVYRRNLQCASSSIYVEPEEKAIGLQWKSNYDIRSDSAHHILEQNTFHYVPILKTLRALFSQPEFKNAYMNNEHVCTTNVFEKFCCGDIYRNSEFYQLNPSAIQLQLAIDDFEVAAPLKTIAGVHKICGIYMQVMNLNQKFQSKLENVSLVALCKTADTKTQNTSLDDILELIVSEIKTLENMGVDIGSGEILKGSLVCFTFDNLGGNGLFGFVESFKANYWCRMCEITKEDSLNTFSEDPSKMRQINHYNAQLSQLENSEDQHVRGVKRRCLLNNINNFHILQNKTVDLMHDVLEGVVPNLLRELFSHCIKNKIISKYSLEARIRD